MTALRALLDVSVKPPCATLPGNRPGRAAAILTAPLYSQTTKRAIEFNALGFNIGVQAIGKKAGYPWRGLQHTRLPEYRIPTLTAERCNLTAIAGKQYGAMANTYLVVFDCETTESFYNLICDFRQRDIPLWAVSSGRGGHIYIRTDKPVKSIKPGVLRDMEIRATGYTLLPGSVHPNGAIYDYVQRDSAIPPLVDLAAIDWLINLDGQSVTLQTKRIRQHKPTVNYGLSQKTRDYLANGANLPADTHHNALRNAACDLAGNGYSQDETDAMLRPIAQQRPNCTDAEITSAIDWAYSQPRTPAAASASKSKSPIWTRAARFAETHTWQGRTATTDRRVFEALIIRCQLGANHSGLFRASERELAELAQLTRKTTRAALRRLQTDGLLKHVEKDRACGANVWAFAPRALSARAVYDKVTPLGTTYLRKPLSSSGVLLSFSNPTAAAETGALGWAGMRIYRAMITLNAPASREQIAEYAGVTVRQVNYAFRPKGWLRTTDTVTSAGRGLWVAQPMTDSELDETIARPAGTLERAARRRDRHQHDRAEQAGIAIYNARLKAEKEYRDTFADVPYYGKTTRQDAAERATTRQSAAPDVQPECTPKTPQIDPVVFVPQGTDRPPVTEQFPEPDLDPLAAFCIAELDGELGENADNLALSIPIFQGELTHV